ncbi:MAG: primosomal protein N' [Polyangiaceae bacterium]
MPLLADVAIPVPLANAFTYAIPEDLAARAVPGARVLVSFARRQTIGVVLSAGEREVPAHLTKVAPIQGVLDDEPVLPAELVRFLIELSAYYFAPIGEVLRLALPAIEREKARALSASGADVSALSRAKQVGGRVVQMVRPTPAIEAAGSLRGQAAAILALLRASGDASIAALEKQHGNARAAVKKLVSLGLVETFEREADRDPFFSEPLARDVAPELTEAQTAAANAINAAIVAHETAGFLLFGITGSGKTEVYLAAIAACLAEGRGALVMVPEIALTPQLVARFRARFGDGLAVLHSALSDGDRHAMWRKLREGTVRVAIGARSALFAPVPDLGLVIVDEEHDGSFKQEEGVRYHARDMALLRAHRAGAVTVLGSATPSIESVQLARSGRLTELILPGRARAVASLPKVEIVNLRTIGPGPTGNPLLSLPLHRALDKALAAGEQAIVFLNRRGFAPSVVCNSCGAVETCKACSVSLTYHRRGRIDDGELFARNVGASPPSGVPRVSGEGFLVCHYCDFKTRLPEVCSGCHAPALVLEGLGTERLETTLREAFPQARIARLDRDVADGKKAQAILAKMHAHEIDILVGTQMVTKGHDLPNVTLVGVVNADAALSLPDFRASERGFQLLVQVAGRAGRHEKPGVVIVQTRQPQHTAIECAATHDVRGFLSRELRDRQEVGYPPFSRLALIRLDAMDEDVAREAAETIAEEAKRTRAAKERLVDVLGPSAAPIARLRGRYRFRVMLRAKERAPLRATTAHVQRVIEDLPRTIRAVIDMDPVSML